MNFELFCFVCEINLKKKIFLQEVCANVLDFEFSYIMFS